MLSARIKGTLSAHEILFGAELAAVVTELQTRVEPETHPDDQAPVPSLHHQSPRPIQRCRAIASQLPIGSGEIERAPLYVIQKRLKLPGAWWSISNSRAILNRRVLRINHLWDNYWDHLSSA